jgi:Flp pilus assembly protein TadB
MAKKGGNWNWKKYGFRQIQETIKEYGYEYSMKKHVTFMGIAVAFLLLLCYLMRIKAAGVCVIVLTVIFVVPILAGYHYRTLYEEKRFADAVDYMEYVIYSFLRMPKIINTLEEVVKVCHGSMKKCIEKAVDRIQYADVYQDIYTDAFAHIEKEYGTERMRALHRFLIQIEQQGGRVYTVLRSVVGRHQAVVRNGLFASERAKRTAEESNSFHFVICSDRNYYGRAFAQ